MGTRTSTLWTGAALSLLLVAAACGGEDQTPQSAAGPSVEITSPAEGASVPAGGVAVSARVSGFSVVDKLNQAAVAGEGHVHFFIDVAQASLPTEAGKPAVSAQGTYHATATTSYTWPDVKAGSHVLCVILVNNDHTSLTPPATDCVTVTVA